VTERVDQRFLTFLRRWFLRLANHPETKPTTMRHAPNKTSSSGSVACLAIMDHASAIAFLSARATPTLTSSSNRSV